MGYVEPQVIYVASAMAALLSSLRTWGSILELLPREDSTSWHNANKITQVLNLTPKKTKKLRLQAPVTVLFTASSSPVGSTTYERARTLVLSLISGGWVFLMIKAGIFLMVLTSLFTLIEVWSVIAVISFFGKKLSQEYLTYRAKKIFKTPRRVLIDAKRLDISTNSIYQIFVNADGLADLYKGLIDQKLISRNQKHIKKYFKWFALALWEKVEEEFYLENKTSPYAYKWMKSHVLNISGVSYHIIGIVHGLSFPGLKVSQREVNEISKKLSAKGIPLILEQKFKSVFNVSYGEDLHDYKYVALKTLEKKGREDILHLPVLIFIIFFYKMTKKLILFGPNLYLWYLEEEAYKDSSQKRAKYMAEELLSEKKESILIVGEGHFLDVIQAVKKVAKEKSSSPLIKYAPIIALPVLLLIAPDVSADMAVEILGYFKEFYNNPAPVIAKFNIYFVIIMIPTMMINLRPKSLRGLSANREISVIIFQSLLMFGFVTGVSSMYPYIYAKSYEYTLLYLPYFLSGIFILALKSFYDHVMSEKSHISIRELYHLKRFNELRQNMAVMAVFDSIFLARLLLSPLSMEKSFLWYALFRSAVMFAHHRSLESFYFSTEGQRYLETLVGKKTGSDFFIMVFWINTLLHRASLGPMDVSWVYGFIEEYL